MTGLAPYLRNSTTAVMVTGLVVITWRSYSPARRKPIIFLVLFGLLLRGPVSDGRSGAEQPERHMTPEP